MKDLLYPLRKLHGWLHEKKNQFIFWKEINFPIGTKYFVVGTPTHTNIGDSAIVIAEKKLLKDCVAQKGKIKEITFNEYPKQYKLISKLFSSHIRFFWHGGGNMGDQWYGEELFRRKFIIDQLKRKPLILPQTIYYTPTKEGRQKQEESIAIYNQEKMTIVAREKKSYDIMKILYPQANILLTPDIVLSTTVADYGVSEQGRSNILWVMRSDAEKSMTDEMRDSIMQAATKTGLPTIQTDMYSDCSVNKENREDCVRKKMQEFCGAKLVITDRLHGMVFAAITGTPCIVFSNYNQKVKGTYEWISYLPYIYYAETVEDAIEAIPKLLKMENCHYDNTPLLTHYEKLKEIILEK